MSRPQHALRVGCGGVKIFVCHRSRPQQALCVGCGGADGAGAYVHDRSTRCASDTRWASDAQACVVRLDSSTRCASDAEACVVRLDGSTRCASDAQALAYVATAARAARRMRKRASYVLTAARAARRMRKRASYVLTAAGAARRMRKRASYVGCVATAARAARRMRKRASYVLTAARAARRMPRRSLMSRRRQQHALRVGWPRRARTYVALRGERMKVGCALSACAPTTLVFLRRGPKLGHARWCEARTSVRAVRRSPRQAAPPNRGRFV
jgi:hypothetical protein